MCKGHTWLRSHRERLYRDGVIDNIILTNENLNSLNSANQKFLSCYVCCMSYHGKQNPDFHWVTTRGYIRVLGLSFYTRVRDRNSSFWLKFCQGGKRNVLPIMSVGSKVGIGLDPDGFSSSLDLMKTVGVFCFDE